MESVNREDEESSISKAVCLPLHSFDLVVCPFQWFGRDGVVIVFKDAFSMDAESLGKVLEHPYSCRFCSGDLIIQMGR